MRNSRIALLSLGVVSVVAVGIACSALVSSVRAQDSDGAPTEVRVHDRQRGELSPGAQAPSRAELLNAIETGAPTKIIEMLEYGERVECHACVPVLERNLLEHNNSEVRRISAWWLRRRPFGFSAIMRNTRRVLEQDADATRRARAAAAIGEFMDPNGFSVLTNAAQSDNEPIVRASAVHALGRLNHPSSAGAIARAIRDDAVEVRRAAVSEVLRVNFFREHDALIEALGDSDVQVRKRAALQLGEFGVDAATGPLGGMLRGDDSRDARQAAAWALGRIGGADARGALREAQNAESDSLVLSAIEVALAM